MSQKVYVPPLKIQGIKTKLVPTIMKSVIVDENTVWIEPFMGSGVVGFNIEPKKAIFSDTNPILIDFYNQIKAGKITSCIVREFLEKEGEKLSELDDKYYYEVRERFNQEQNPLDFLFLNRACFNGMIRFNRNGAFNVPYGHKPNRFSKAYITKIVNQVRHMEVLLQSHDWTFLCQPFDIALSHIPAHAFIYCDPPYIGRNVDYYDSWNEHQEQLLCDLLKKTSEKFMLSTWDHNEYRKNEYLDQLWHFCRKTNIEHFYHVGGKEDNRKPMIEALLTNYTMEQEENKLLFESEQVSFETRAEASA